MVTHAANDPTFLGMYAFCDGYCSTVQVLLGVHPSFHLFKSICVFCVFLFSSRPVLDILHCLPRAVGVPLQSALNLVSRMSPCGAHDTHACYKLDRFACVRIPSQTKISWLTPQKNKSAQRGFLKIALFLPFFN